MRSQFFGGRTIVHLTNINAVFIEATSHFIQLTLNRSLSGGNICELVVHLSHLALHFSCFGVFFITIGPGGSLELPAAAAAPCHARWMLI